MEAPDEPIDPDLLMAIELSKALMSQDEDSAREDVPISEASAPSSVAESQDTEIRSDDSHTSYFDTLRSVLQDDLVFRDAITSSATKALLPLRNTLAAYATTQPADLVADKVVYLAAVAKLAWLCWAEQAPIATPNNSPFIATLGKSCLDFSVNCLKCLCGPHDAKKEGSKSGLADLELPKLVSLRTNLLGFIQMLISTANIGGHLAVMKQRREVKALDIPMLGPLPLSEVPVVPENAPTDSVDNALLAELLAVGVTSPSAPSDSSEISCHKLSSACRANADYFLRALQGPAKLLEASVLSLRSHISSPPGLDRVTRDIQHVRNVINLLCEDGLFGDSSQLPSDAIDRTFEASALLVLELVRLQSVLDKKERGSLVGRKLVESALCLATRVDVLKFRSANLQAAVAGMIVLGRHEDPRLAPKHVGLSEEPEVKDMPKSMISLALSICKKFWSPGAGVPAPRSGSPIPAARPEFTVNGFDILAPHSMEELRDHICRATDVVDLSLRVLLWAAHRTSDPATPEPSAVPSPPPPPAGGKNRRKKKDRKKKRSLADSSKELLPLAALFSEKASTEASGFFTEVASTVLELVTASEDSLAWAKAHWQSGHSTLLLRLLSQVRTPDVQSVRNLAYGLVAKGVMSSESLRDILTQASLLSSSWPLQPSAEHVFLAARVVVQLKKLGHFEASRAMLSGFLRNLQLHLWDDSLGDEPCSAEFSDLCLLIYHLDGSSDRAAVMANAAAAIHSVADPSRAGDTKDIIVLAHLVQLVSHMAAYLQGSDQEVMEKLKSSLFRGDTASSGIIRSDDGQPPFSEEAKALLLPAKDTAGTFAILLKLSCTSSSSDAEAGSPQVFAVCWSFLTRLHAGPVVGHDSLPPFSEDSFFVMSFQRLYAACKRIETAQSEDLPSLAASLLPFSTSAVIALCDHCNDSTEDPGGLFHACLAAGILLLRSVCDALSEKQSSAMDVDQGEGALPEGLAQHRPALVSALHRAVNAIRKHEEQARAQALSGDVPSDVLSLATAAFTAQIPRHVFRTGLEAFLVSSETISSLLGLGAAPPDVSSSLSPVDAIVVTHPPSASKASAVQSWKRTHMMVLKMLSSLLTDEPVDATRLSDQSKAIVDSLLPLCHNASFDYLSRTAKKCLSSIVSRQSAAATSERFRIDCQRDFLAFIQSDSLPSPPSDTSKFDACEAFTCHVVKVIHEIITAPSEKLGPVLRALEAPDSDPLPLTSVFKLQVSSHNTKFNVAALKLLSVALKTQGPLSGSEALARSVAEMQHIGAVEWRSFIEGNLLAKIGEQDSATSTSTEVRRQAVRLLLSICSNPVAKAAGGAIAEQLLHVLPEAILGWTSCRMDYLQLTRSFAARFDLLGSFVATTSKVLESTEFSKQVADGSLLGVAQLLKSLRDLIAGLYGKQEQKKGDSAQSDGGAAEESLDSKLCTYTATEDTFQLQHWYYCYTCKLTFTEGVCTVCAQVCHKGHELSYARKSRFYCDCGAGAKDNNCKALKARAAASEGTNLRSSAGSLPDLEGDSWLEEVSADAAASAKAEMEGRAFAASLVSLLERLLATADAPESTMAASKAVRTTIGCGNKSVVPKSDLFHPQRAVPSSLSVQLNLDQPERSELKALFAATGAVRNALAMSSDGFVAVAELESVDIGTVPGLLEGSGTSSAKYAAVAKCPTVFPVMQMQFNEAYPSFLAIAGVSNCEIVTLTSTGTVQDRLQLELGLEGMGEAAMILRVMWVPGSQVQLAVVTNQFIKIYDLSADAISPQHFLTLIEDSIRDATFVKKGDRLKLLTVGNSGMLYTHEIARDASDGGPCIMIATVPLEPSMLGKSGRSIHYSPYLDLVFASFADSKSFAGRLNFEDDTFENTFPLVRSSSTTYACWVDIPQEHGAVMCLGTQKSAAVGMVLKEREVLVQALRSSSPSSSVIGICNCPQADSPSALILLDDGSIHRFDVSGSSVPEGSAPSGSSQASPQPSSSGSSGKSRKSRREGASEALKKAIFSTLKRKGLREKKESGKAKSGTKAEEPSPEFPLEFFETVDCVTDKIELGGDVLLCYSADEAKSRLQKNDEYLVSPNKDMMTIEVSVPSTNNCVLVGTRVLVGNAAPEHVPKLLSVFGRTIPLKEGFRKWYDIPFTTEETLKGGNGFILRAVGCHTADKEPLIDSMEVYGLSKQAFGWTEKMKKFEAAAASAKRPKPSTDQEKALSECCSLLTEFFLGGSSPSAASNEGIRAKLMSLVPSSLNNYSLLAVHTPLKNLLAALFADKTEYYRLKDAAQLTHIGDTILSTNVPFDSASRFEQFLETISKVVVLRPANFALFLQEYSLFPAAFSKLFWSLHERKGWTSVVQVARQMMDVLHGVLMFAYKGGQGRASLRPSFALMSKFLLSEDERLRFAATKRLIYLLSGSSDSADFIGTAEEAPVIRYCCDKCGNGKFIEGTRWHCDECEDLDLCDSCHETLSEALGDHKPHHKMTRHSAGGDATPAVSSPEEGLNHFTSLSASPAQQRKGDSSIPVGADPDDDEGLLRIALAMSMDSSDVVMSEAGESGNKVRTKSSLATMLRELFLEDLESFAGDGNSMLAYGSVLFQLSQQSFSEEPSESGFESLADKLLSVVALEGLSDATPAKKELALLVVKFFDALIMDPRKDTKSSMAPAVSAVLGGRGVQKALLSLCQQFLAAFASGAYSKPENVDTGKGKLLRPGASSATESIFPFFSKAFSKGKDSLFEGVEVQLLNASFRLASHMHDPEVFAECKSDWIDVLCTTILGEFEGIESKPPKQLLRSLCGSRAEYHLVRDSRVFAAQEAKLRSIGERYNGFRVELAYSDVVSLMQELKTTHKIVKSRPENWRPFVADRPSLLTFLLKSVFYFDEEPTSLCLELIALAFIPDNEIQARKKKRKAQKGKSTDSSSPPEDAHMEDDSAQSSEFSATIHGILEDGTLSRLVNVFLLEYNTETVRKEVSNILKWLWLSCSPPDRKLLFEMLSAKVPRLPSYGKNAAEFMGLLSFVVTEVAKKTTSKEVASVFSSMFGSLQAALVEQNLLLSNHANSHLYRTLAGLVDFDGYYLESEPCLVCNDPEVPFSKCDLSSIRTEAKYTDSSILVKLDSSYSIKGITIHADDTRPSRMIRVINLYCNNKPVQDIVELRGNWNAWKKVQSCNLKRKQSVFQVDFPIPVTATNFMIEYADFYEDIQAMASERLMCPRCSRTVHDKNGICKHCHENAHQCRQCRNINYENLSAFQCNECGFSKYGNFSFTFNARQSFASERMESTEDRDHGMEIINTESTNAYRRYQQVLSLKRHIVTVISMINTESSVEGSDYLARFSIAASSQHGKVDPKVAMLASLYGKECKQSFDSLSQSARKLLATRRELVRFNSKASAKPDVVDAKARPANSCFGCGNDFVALYLSFIDSVARQAHLRQVFVSQGLLQELLSNNLQGSAQLRTTTRRVIALLTENNMTASTMLTELLKEKLRFCLQNHRSLDLASSVRNEIQLIIDLAAIEDDCWEHRFKLVVDLFFFAMELGASNPVMSEQVILPCLKYLSSVISPAQADLAKVVPPSSTPTVDYEQWKAKQTTFSEWRRAFSKSFIAGEGALDDKALGLLRRVANKWKLAAGLPPTYFTLSMLPIDSIDLGWMGQLLFSSSSRPVRVEVVSLLEGLACSSARSRSVLLALCDLLPGASACGDVAAEYFALFKKLIEPLDCRVFLARRDFLVTLTNLVAEEVAHIRGQESTFTSDISQGFVLKTYISILLMMLELPGTRRLFKTKKLTVSLLNSFLSLRGVIVQKTKLTEDSSTMLLDLLKSLHADNEKDNQLFITGCIKALETHNKGREPIFIFEQLCNIVCPEKPKPQYFVNLIKSPTQEEFIRGSMTKNPYLVTDIGNLMQDVKDKICRDLELYMELQMELLVCNKIIALDVPVDLVFEQVWLKDGRNEGIENSEDAPPMDVIYRLQGLDGEATEDIVESLETSDGDEMDPEEQFKVASIMCECGGLEAMVRQIEGISDFKEDMELARLVLRLLYHSLKLRVNREAIVRMGSITVLLDKLMLVFPNESQAEIADLLLLTVETIVNEANHLQEEERGGKAPSTSGLRRNRSFNELACNEDDVNEKRSQMETFLSKIGSPLVRCNPRIVKSMTRIIPVLTYGMRPIEETLVHYFMEFITFADFDELPYEDETRHFHLECFSAVAESIQPDDNGLRLKRLFLELGVTQSLFDYLHATLPKKSDAAADDWAAAVEKRSLPYVLPTLAGLTRGVEEAQSLSLQNNLIPRLHHMAGLSTKNKVGNLAETLLEALREGCAAVTDFLDEHQAAEKQKKKEEALKHRQRVLSAMGIKQETDTRLVPASMLEDSIDEDEEGFTCRVCREGYTFLPKSTLGFYVYSTRVPLVRNAGRQDYGYKTVTNLNTIHFSCHRDAVKADSNLRPRKEEWEGAMLRNSSTLCNNIFPMLGPDTPLEDYSSHVDAYFQNQAQNCGRCESTKFRLVAHDLSALLLRFSKEESFSSDSRGGSNESNLQSTPFFLQMGSFLLNASAGAQRTVHQQALSQFLAQVKSPVEFWLDASKQANNPLYFITTTLFLLSLEEWRTWRLYLLKRAVVHALVEASAAAEEEKDEGEPKTAEQKVFATVRHALLFFQLVNNLQEALKEGEPGDKPSPGSDVEHSPDAAWIKALETATRTKGHVLAEKCREVVQEFEEFGRFHYESAEEFFDDLELRLDGDEAPSPTALLVSLQTAAIASQ